MAGQGCPLAYSALPLATQSTVSHDSKLLCVCVCVDLSLSASPSFGNSS